MAFATRYLDILLCPHEADIKEHEFSSGSCDLCFRTTFYTCRDCGGWICEDCKLPPPPEFPDAAPAPPLPQLWTPDASGPQLWTPPLPQLLPPPSLPPPAVKYTIYYVICGDATRTWVERRARACLH